MSDPTADTGQARAGRAADWVRSSFSFSNGNCVEVAILPGGYLGIRDSKDPAGPGLRFSADEWSAFLAGVRNGEFDVSAGGTVIGMP